MKIPQLQTISAPTYSVFAAELEPGDVVESTDLLPSPDAIHGWVPVYPLIIGMAVPPDGFGTPIIRP